MYSTHKSTLNERDCISIILLTYSNSILTLLISLYTFPLSVLNMAWISINQIQNLFCLPLSASSSSWNWSLSSHQTFLKVLGWHTWSLQVDISKHFISIFLSHPPLWHLSKISCKICEYKIFCGALIALKMS